MMEGINDKMIAGACEGHRRCGNTGIQNQRF